VGSEEPQRHSPLLSTPHSLTEKYWGFFDYLGGDAKITSQKPGFWSARVRVARAQRDRGAIRCQLRNRVSLNISVGIRKSPPRNRVSDLFAIAHRMGLSKGAVPDGSEYT